MFRPVRIKIRNFLSIEDIEYFFKQGETVLVQGINNTDPSQKSNGSGKSAFQAAIDFVNTNSCARKIGSDKELIRENQEDDAFLEMEWDNTFYKCNLVIQRTLSFKNSSTLKILENSVPVEFATVPEGNRLLTTLLGVSTKDIHNYFFPNELTYISFFKSSDTDIKDLISRFSKTNVLDPVFGYITVDEELKKTELETAKTNRTKFETEINLYQLEIETEENRDFKQEKLDAIIEIQKKIDQKEIDIVSQKTLKTTKTIEQNTLKITNIEVGKKITETSIKISDREKDCDQSEFFKECSIKRTELSTSRSKEETDKTTKGTELNKWKESLSEVNTFLAGAITCPKCHYIFTLESEKTIDQLNEEKKEYEKKTKKIGEEIEKIQTKLIEFDEQLSTVTSLEDETNIEITEIREKITELNKFLTSYNTQVTQNSAKITRLETEIQACVSNVNIYESEVKSFDTQIEDIKKSKQDKTRLDDLKKKKTDSETNLEWQKVECERLEKELFEIVSWTNRFKSFKSFLANKQLKAITGYTNKYLRDFGTDIEVNIEGYKQLASGEMREKVTAYVYRGGRVKSYGQFSKGERGKIDYSVMLALQTLINITSTTGGLDLMFADEVIEGMDSLGLSLLLKSLSKTEKTNLLTTHMAEVLDYQNSLIFVKENSITKIQ